MKLAHICPRYSADRLTPSGRDRQTCNLNSWPRELLDHHGRQPGIDQLNEHIDRDPVHTDEHRLGHPIRAVGEEHESSIPILRSLLHSAWTQLFPKPNVTTQYDQSMIFADIPTRMRVVYDHSTMDRPRDPSHLRGWHTRFT